MDAVLRSLILSSLPGGGTMCKIEERKVESAVEDGAPNKQSAAASNPEKTNERAKSTVTDPLPWLVQRLLKKSGA